MWLASSTFPSTVKSFLIRGHANPQARQARQRTPRLYTAAHFPAEISRVCIQTPRSRCPAQWLYLYLCERRFDLRCRPTRRASERGTNARAIGSRFAVRSACERRLEEDGSRQLRQSKARAADGRRRGGHVRAAP